MNDDWDPYWDKHDWVPLDTSKYLKPKFKVSDRVKLKGGSAEIEVHSVSLNGMIRGRYVKSDNWVDRNWTAFEYFASNDEYTQAKAMENMMKLYQFQIDNADHYGHYLATDSNGNWVMEVKGSGAIVAIPKKDVQEVLPFTIGVKFGDSGKTYHYLAEAGKVDLGFYIVNSNYEQNGSGYVITQVVALDTKSASATKEFAPLAKLNTL